MKTLKFITRIALCALPLLTSLAAQAQTMRVRPLAEVGAGMETPLSHGGSFNLLLRVGGGVGIGGNHCDTLDVACMPRNAQLVVATIEATAALNPGASGADILQYMNVRFTPLSIPISSQTTMERADGIAAAGRDIGVHLDVLPARLQRDIRVNREADVWVGAVGIDARLQTFPEVYFGMFLQAAADVLGYRYTRQSVGSELHSIHAAHGRLETGMMFLLDQAVVIRLSGGAESSVGAAVAGGGTALVELEAFGQLTVSITRIVEIYARLSSTHRWLEGAGFSDHRSVEQFTAGLTLRFD